MLIQVESSGGRVAFVFVMFPGDLEDLKKERVHICGEPLRELLESALRLTGKDLDLGECRIGVRYEPSEAGHRLVAEAQGVPTEDLRT